MPEDVANFFASPKFSSIAYGTPRGIIDNYTTTRDKISLNGLGMEKGKSGDISMILKTGI